MVEIIWIVITTICGAVIGHLMQHWIVGMIVGFWFGAICAGCGIEEGFSFLGDMF